MLPAKGSSVWTRLARRLGIRTYDPEVLFRFSKSSIVELEEAGWYAGRTSGMPAELPSDFTLFPAAVRALGEFGGLHIGRSGRRKSIADVDIEFQPGLGDGLSEFVDKSPQNGTKIFPLGEAGNRHLNLFIDESGSVFALGELGMHFVAGTLDQAIDRLLTGAL